MAIARALKHQAQPVTVPIAMRIFRDMLRIRMVEEEIAARYSQEKMRCPVHLSIGQEAVPAAVSAALRPSDQVVSTHRCHAHYLAKGGELKAMLCELMGRASGCCGGRGGSMHLFDQSAGVLLSLPIVAASIPIGVGAALAMKQTGSDNVAVVYLGDAAVEEGAFHESANFASVHSLPVLFVCENNLYSVYTPLDQRQPARPITELARAHGIASLHVDGNDAGAVYAAALQASARARVGNGPTFIQADTYRWREHCGPNYDNALGYRSVDEFTHWKTRDPIEAWAQHLSTLGWLDGEDRARLTGEIMAEIAEAFASAESDPFPTPETAERHLYAE